jgi:hypothetical protein
LSERAPGDDAKLGYFQERANAKYGEADGRRIICVLRRDARALPVAATIVAVDGSLEHCLRAS